MDRQGGVLLILKLQAAVLVVIALTASAACGGSSSPQQASAKSPAPAAACKTVQVQATQVSLGATDSPTAGFQLPLNTQPVGIALDSDSSSVWVLGTGLDRVLRVASTGEATAYQLQRSGLGIQLSVASDGTVWIPEQFRDAVVSIAGDGTAKECTLPGKDREPLSTSVAADGSVWVSESRGAAIAHLVNGRFTEYPIGVQGAQGAEVLASSDGGAWFTVNGAPVLGHVSAQGDIERISINGSGSALGLLETPDGAVWVADFGGDRLIRVAKDRTQLVWNAPPGAKPQGLALGAAGVVWATESGADVIARVQGSALEQTVRTGHWPDHLAITPDGWAWFTEYNGDRLGRVRLPGS